MKCFILFYFSDLIHLWPGLNLVFIFFLVLLKTQQGNNKNSTVTDWMNEWRSVHSTFQSCRWIKFWLSSTTNACTAHGAHTHTHIADARTDSAFDIRCVQSLSLLLNSASYAVTFHRSLYTDDDNDVDDNNQFKLLSFMFVCTKISPCLLTTIIHFFSKAGIFILRDQHLKFFFLFICLFVRCFFFSLSTQNFTQPLKKCTVVVAYSSL